MTIGTNVCIEYQKLSNFDDLTTPLTIVHLTSDNRLMLIKADRVYAHFLKSSQSEKWAHFKAPSPSLSHARPDLHYIELGLLEPLQTTMLAEKVLYQLLVCQIGEH